MIEKSYDQHELGVYRLPSMPSFIAQTVLDDIDSLARPTSCGYIMLSCFIVCFLVLGLGLGPRCTKKINDL